MRLPSKFRPYYPVRHCRHLLIILTLHLWPSCGRENWTLNMLRRYSGLLPISIIFSELRSHQRNCVRVHPIAFPKVLRGVTEGWGRGCPSLIPTTPSDSRVQSTAHPSERESRISSCPPAKFRTRCGLLCDLVIVMSIRWGSEREFYLIPAAEKICKPFQWFGQGLVN